MSADLPWGLNPVNYIAIIVFTMLAIFYLRRFLNIAPSVWGGLFRWKDAVSVETSVSKMRDRRSVAVLFTIPFCLMVSRYKLWTPDALSLCPEGFESIAIYTCFLVAVSVRLLFCRVFGPGGSDSGFYWQAVRAGYSYFILGVSLMLLVVGVCSAIGVNDAIVRTLLYYLMALIYAIFSLRRTEILSVSVGRFNAFLYLCVLEFLPAALVIATAVFL